MGILPGSGPLGSGPTGPGSGFSVMPFMGHENGGKQRLAKRRHVQGMLDETDPLSLIHTWSFGFLSSCRKNQTTKDSNCGSLSFGSFCTTLTIQTT